MRNRKWWVYITALIAILVLAFFDHTDACSYCVMLATALFAGNVAQKFANTGEKE